MPKLSPISPKKFTKILKFLGFVELRVKGSHHFFLHKESGKTTVIPMHGNEDIGVGLVKEILKDIELSADDFNRLKNKV